MGTKVPRYERSQERKFQGTFVPRERKVPGKKVPGTFVPGEKRKVLHRHLLFLGTKGLVYEKSVIPVIQLQLGIG